MHDGICDNVAGTVSQRASGWLWYTTAVWRPGGRAAPHNGTEDEICWHWQRGEGQSIIIDGHIEVKIVKWSRSSVRLAIQAPREVTVDRDEIWRKTHPGQATPLEVAEKSATSVSPAKGAAAEESGAPRHGRRG